MIYIYLAIKIYLLLYILPKMFSQADFQGENLHRLCVIIMNSLDKHPLTQFHTLSNAYQKLFDRNEILAKEIARTINITIRDNSIPFMD